MPVGNNTQQMERLIVLLSDDAVSFCSYANPAEPSAPPQWMPVEMVEQAIEFAGSKGLTPIYLIGDHGLSAEHAEAIKKSEHALVVPYALYGQFPASIPVLKPHDVAERGSSPNAPIAVAILRISKDSLPELRRCYQRLLGQVKRLNVCLVDVGRFSDDDFKIYQEALGFISRMVVSSSWPEFGTECNVVTDRLMLKSMNNCDAGIRHITLAPNGRFYLCPAFFYDNPAETVGSLQEGVDIKNAHLLTIEFAPICRRCDAFHCRRCVFLNKKLTDEINTPSRQQCVTAHIERNESRSLLGGLVASGLASRTADLSEVPAIDYIDPFELAKDGERGPGTGEAPPGDNGPAGRADPAAMDEIRTQMRDIYLSNQTILREIQHLREEIIGGQQSTARSQSDVQRNTGTATETDRSGNS
jgi:CXXX repeat peptide maturase